MAVLNQPSPAPHSASLTGRSLLLGGILALASLSSCSTSKPIPKGVEVAKNFDPLRFEGTWYELARTNHPDEAGLTRVSANYKRNADGTWLVSDRAWNNATGAWVGSQRIAKSEPTPGSFKLKHAKPRNVVFIDSEHSMAVVCSNTYRQFWVISKNPEPDHNRFDRMLALAQDAGFPVKEAFVVPTR